MRGDDNIRALRAPRSVSARFVLSLALAALGAAPLPAVAAPTANYAARPDVRVFVDELVRDYGFRRAALRKVFSQVRQQPAVVAAMQRPFIEPPKWYDYARPFLAPVRVDGGVAWWNANAEALARAERRYGVPAEVIVAIVGVETFYGRNVGTYRALDALATLAFDYPRRAEFFRGELTQFLLLAR